MRRNLPTGIQKQQYLQRGSGAGRVSQHRCVVRSGTGCRGKRCCYGCGKVASKRVEDGDSLLARLRNGDHRALATFTNDANQLNEWIAGFSRTLIPENLFHTCWRSKVFPVGEGYHLLSPLFATSLAHVLYQKMAAVRFRKEAKDIRKARSEKMCYPISRTIFPDSAEMHFGAPIGRMFHI